MPERIALDVNGRTRQVEVEPDTPLLLVLRNDLGLTAAKFGCGLEQCGACKVIVDGEAVFSCREPVDAFAGRRITTLEGIGTAEKLHPLQRAFIEEQAAQCGYCIPGIIVAAKALLDRNPDPSRRGDSRRAGGPSLSLRLARANHQGREASGAGRGTMSELSPSLQRNPDLDSWVRIDDDGTVTLFTGKVELGQGIRTAIARIGAEELDVSLARDSRADGRHGARSQRAAHRGQRLDGGERHGDAPGRGRGPAVTCSSSRRSISASARTSSRSTTAPCPLPASIAARRTGSCSAARGSAVRSPVTCSRSGRPTTASSARPRERIDLAAIVTGTARFVQDLTRPGMLYGRVVRPPSPAARLESIDETRARGLPGVVARGARRQLPRRRWRSGRSRR